MIGHYKMSLIGSSHLSKKGGVCQDSCDAKKLQNGWVIAAIADGLGSAKHSEIGSSIAVETVISFSETNIPDLWHDESMLSLLRTAFHCALKQIKEKADSDRNHVRDYETTLTSVIYNGTNAVFGHVGDGGVIALNHYGEFSLLTVAQKGETFNSVVPLRAGPDAWMFGKTEESIAALLMMTDGIYDVACPWLLMDQEQKIQKIWVNYVRRFIDRNKLPVNTDADFETAQKEIEAFFSDKHVPTITDDKTILGIINTDIMPEVKFDEYYADPDWIGLRRKYDELLYGKEDDVAPDSKDEKVVDYSETDSHVETEMVNNSSVPTENQGEHINDQTMSDENDATKSSERQSDNVNLQKDDSFFYKIKSLILQTKSIKE